MNRTVSATDARIRLGELMRWVVESQQPVVVERGGAPYVVLLSVDEYERLRAGQQEQQDWRSLVRQSRRQIEAERGGRELTSAEEVLRQVRQERDERLLGPC